MIIEILNSVNCPIGIGTTERITFMSFEEAERLYKELGEKLSEYREYRKMADNLPETETDLL